MWMKAVCRSLLQRGSLDRSVVALLEQVKASPIPNQGPGRHRTGRVRGYVSGDPSYSRKEFPVLPAYPAHAALIKRYLNSGPGNFGKSPPNNQKSQELTSPPEIRMLPNEKASYTCAPRAMRLDKHTAAWAGQNTLPPTLPGLRALKSRRDPLFPVHSSRGHVPCPNFMYAMRTGPSIPAGSIPLPFMQRPRASPHPAAISLVLSRDCTSSDCSAEVPPQPAVDEVLSTGNGRINSNPL